MDPRLEPSGLSPTIGERLMIHAQGLALSKVEPCSLILKPTGRCLSMKTSTLPQPQSLSESKEATETERRKHVDSSSRPSRPLSVEDTLVAKLDKAREVTLEDFKALVLQAAPRLLSGTFMTIGWTFLPRTSVCTTRSV